MKLRKEYVPARVYTRVTFFVHPRRLEAGTDGAGDEPPLPPKELGKGYPVWILEHRGRELRFASPAEMAHVADVLGQRVLPRPWQLYDKAGRANGHWLSRLHSSWRPWKVRERVVEVLRRAL